MLTFVSGKDEAQEAQDLEGQQQQANTELDLVAWQVVAAVVLGIGGALTYLWLSWP